MSVKTSMTMMTMMTMRNIAKILTSMTRRDVEMILDAKLNTMMESMSAMIMTVIKAVMGTETMVAETVILVKIQTMMAKMTMWIPMTIMTE